MKVYIQRQKLLLLPIRESRLDTQLEHALDQAADVVAILLQHGRRYRQQLVQRFVPIEMGQ